MDLNLIRIPENTSGQPQSLAMSRLHPHLVISNLKCIDTKQWHSMTRHYVSSEKVPGKQEVVVARQEHDLLQVALPARPPEYRIAILY